MTKKKYCAILILLVVCILKSYSQDTISSIVPMPDEVGLIEQAPLPDTLAVEVASSDSVPQAAPVKKDNVFKKFFNQLFKGNKDKTHERPIDLSFVVFPFYSQEASVGLGGVVTALYRIDRTDIIIQPSDLQFFAKVTLKGEYKISIGGNNHFNRKSRIHYYAQFYNKPLDFWGI